jgi:hypothetical protein
VEHLRNLDQNIKLMLRDWNLAWLDIPSLIGDRPSWWASTQTSSATDRRTGR